MYTHVCIAQEGVCLASPVCMYLYACVPVDVCIHCGGGLVPCSSCLHVYIRVWTCVSICVCTCECMYTWRRRACALFILYVYIELAPCFSCMHVHICVGTCQCVYTLRRKACPLLVLHVYIYVCVYIYVYTAQEASCPEIYSEAILGVYCTYIYACVHMYM